MNKYELVTPSGTTDLEIMERVDDFYDNVRLARRLHGIPTTEQIDEVKRNAQEVTTNHRTRDIFSACWFSPDFYPF